MDKDANNSVDPDEWAAAEGMTTDYGASTSAAWTMSMSRRLRSRLMTARGFFELAGGEQILSGDT